MSETVHWRIVDAKQFAEYLHRYPRRWVVDPPLRMPAGIRYFHDESLEAAETVIAVWNLSPNFGSFAVRV